ncbi:hypothetical protein BT93_L4130 [Corymbia citriodora subsp. variegata]|uniref:ADP-ribosyl cyclase/cyclic ADP-ribose hydrolase n=1 Tax=Corymbia citriodora subsp. variegata TaxID=360336 RepID=A0A8T0CX62_CORYI|nr:hypothetical protein BT93_L4130 [Corymbia citriodora subsp. variegata]
MASSNPKRYYHVFLSFRGADVCKNFLSHLYAALDQKGLNTFVDSEELRKGEEISPALIRAIEESRVAIIVFSKDYASSPWCLDELLKIMECKERNGLMVLPVFYKVEPREVRRGRESYERAIADHESKFGKDSEKVNRWKKALFEAGSLSGWDFNERNEDEADLIKCIVKDISGHLYREPLHVAKYPVGIDPVVEELKWLSQKESDDDDVLTIGLWGPGGIGKTTIAKALFNAIERQFQGCSFLARVRETSKSSDGLVVLQNKLLSEILSQQDLIVHSVDRGINLIQERLCCKKVLLVLDDVDQLDQLNALAGGGNWFGKGSRIIVTSRDKHLLTFHSKNFVYEVQTLKFDEALNLFYQHAFPHSKRVEIRGDLIDKVVQYASHFPLALELLGSFLRGRDESAWESTLHKLSKIPEKTINQVLKISFDGLEDEEKEIFLDLACFFKGKSMMYVKEVLDSCDFSTNIGIEILIERSLIKNENEFLQMHDLIQLMGKDIVNRECSNDPRKRSRLWLFEDFQDIIYENTEMNAIKAIILDLRRPEEITVTCDTFSNMKMLRILILLEVHISSQGPVRLPNELGYLKWPNAPDLEFGPGLKKLKRLDVPKSHIKQLWGNLQGFRKLKFINFTNCKSLVSVPDLSSAPNLESLSLDGCKSLVEVHQSIGCLENLKILRLNGCSNLKIFPNTLKSKPLQILGLSGCSKLEKFPDILEKMGLLQCLMLQGTAIKELPTSIKNLVFLKRINLELCKNLARLPSSIYKLKNLKYLIITNCSSLVMFPKNMKDSTDLDGDLGFQNLGKLVLSGSNLLEVEFLESSSSFPKLRDLDLSNNKFTHLPTCINKYNDLRSFFVHDCKQLQEIPKLPSNLYSLIAYGCKSLQELPDLSSHSHESLLVELPSCRELPRKGLTLANVSLLEEVPKKEFVDICQSGSEIPEWFLHDEGGSVSFMVPQDLCDKVIGLAYCVVLGLEEGKVVDPACEVSIIIDNGEVIPHVKYLRSLESDHMWLHYSRLNIPQNCLGSSHIQVCASSSTGSIKKCGYRLICKQQRDDLRVVFPASSADSKQIGVSRKDTRRKTIFNRLGGRRLVQLKQMMTKTFL